MNQDSLVLILTIFVGLVAISQLGMMLAVVMVARQVKVLQEHVLKLSPKIEATMLTVRDTLDQTRQHASQITAHLSDATAKLTEVSAKVHEVSEKVIGVTAQASDVLRATRTQIGRVEDLLIDVTGRAKVQMDRAELVLDDTMGRVHETVAVLHNGVMKPLKEINGISTGIRAAIRHMLKGGRPSVAQATQDEEMFI